MLAGSPVIGKCTLSSYIYDLLLYLNDKHKLYNQTNFQGYKCGFHDSVTVTGIQLSFGYTNSTKTTDNILLVMTVRNILRVIDQVQYLYSDTENIL